MNKAIRVDKNTFYKYNEFVTRCNNFVTNKKESCNNVKETFKDLWSVCNVYHNDDCSADGGVCRRE